MLNCEILHLVKLYRSSLGDIGHKVNTTIEMLTHTSALIRNFRDSRPITDVSDDRLKENNDALQWLIKWEQIVKEDKMIKNKEKHLISYHTREDIISSIMGYEELCMYKLMSYDASTILSRVNSDVIENRFCQQRTLHNGANTVNSVILGQTSVFRSSNAGGGEGGQLPLNRDAKSMV